MHKASLTLKTNECKLMHNLHGEMLHPYVKFPFAQNPIQMTKNLPSKGKNENM